MYVSPLQRRKVHPYDNHSDTFASIPKEVTESILGRDSQ